MTDVASRVVARVGRPVATGLAVLLVVALGAVGYLVYEGTRGSTYTITAEFPATPGLYPHNSVDILGVPKGTITAITAHPSYVAVRMSLPTGVHVPADAQAVLMAPNPVSDRFVQLTPPYVPGPHTTPMAPGAVIPLARSIVPLELDGIFQNVDQLARMLGPSGANSDGQLSAVLHAFAGLVNGNGPDVHTAITQIAAALPALTAHPDDLKNLVEGLDTLSRTLAAHDATLDSLYSDLAQSTTQLADERQLIGSAVANLQQGMAQVAAFIKANEANLGGAVRNLSSTVAAVMREQQALIQTFDTAPLGFQNFNRAIDPTTACDNATGTPKDCAALWGRVDFTSDAMQVVKEYCGNSSLNSLLPILASNLGAPKQALDTVCAAEFGALSERQPSPGAPTSPDLDLTHYLGTGGSR